MICREGRAVQVERGEDPGAPARPDPPGRAQEAAEQRGSPEAVCREVQPGRARLAILHIDREGFGVISTAAI